MTRDTPGIDVRISVRRASPSSSASRFPISVSMAARCRSSWRQPMLVLLLQ